MSLPRRLGHAPLALVLLSLLGFSSPIVIDTPPPADSGSPWQSLARQSTITFAFMDSWDGVTWPDPVKAVALAAISDLDQKALPYNSLIPGNPDFTMRWGGSDFFRNWRDGGTYSDPGWDLSNPLAVAYKHNNGPWDHTKFPNNEIYFNSAYGWSFGLGTVDPNGYDFWTVLQHEIIHMLACDSHATHENEVMYESVAKGVRKTLQESDKEILRKAGYYIPEPGTTWLVLTGAALMILARRRTGRSG